MALYYPLRLDHEDSARGGGHRTTPQFPSSSLELTLHDSAEKLIPLSPHAGQRRRYLLLVIIPNFSNTNPTVTYSRACDVVYESAK